MRTKRHQVLARLLVSSLLITGVQVSMTTTWAATIKNGDACSPAGATFKQGATEFVCTKSGSKVVWKSKKKADRPSKEAFSSALQIFPAESGFSPGKFPGRTFF
jgi:hypothetical protein